MNALSSNLADALTAVCDALGDTLREVRMEHGWLKLGFGAATLSIDPDGYWRHHPGTVNLTDEQIDAFDALAAEVEVWCSEQLAQAVEDTDWTGRCRVCDGRGWVEGVDHAPDCHTTGECVCEGVPVQTACLACTGQPEGDDDAPF